jgi:hypothetical protein
MYKLTDSDNVIRLVDNGTVPIDNIEYEKYLTWVADGNTPEPANVIVDNSEYLALIRRRAEDLDDGTVEGKLESLLTLKTIGE